MDDIPAEFPRQVESQRLTLRCYRPDDAGWYYAMSLKNQEHLRRYESENVAFGIQDEEQAQNLLRELADAWVRRDYFFVGVFDKHDGEFVAQVYVGPMDWHLPEFQIGYFADVGHEGQGYVSEAVTAVLQVLFSQLGAHRVSLKCDETNLRSIRVAERCRFTREGRLRENRRSPDGTYSNSLIFGLLSSEFPAP